VVFRFVGETVDLDATIADRATSYYVQALIFKANVLQTTVNLTHQSNGRHYGTWIPSSAGIYYILYTAYTDVGFATYADRYDVSDEYLQVLPGPVSDEGGVVRQSYTLDTTSNSIIVNTWLELDGDQVTTGLSAATLLLCYSDGTVIASPAAVASPIAPHGVFRFVFAAPVFAIGENATFSVATVNHAGPPARVFRGVTGVTFSRSA
jgi:hypothetical protein